MNVNQISEMYAANFAAVYTRLPDGRQSNSRDPAIYAVRQQSVSVARGQTRRQVGDAKAYDNWRQAELRARRDSGQGSPQSFGPRRANGFRPEMAVERRESAAAHGTDPERDPWYPDAPAEEQVINVRGGAALLVLEGVRLSRMTPRQYAERSDCSTTWRRAPRANPCPRALRF